MSSSFSNQRPRPFSISVTSANGRVFVAPSGELDISTCPALRSRIDEIVQSGAAGVVLDLREVSFIDSTGVKLLLDQMSNEQLAFGVVAGPEPIQRMFKTLGIVDLIPFVPAP